MKKNQKEIFSKNLKKWLSIRHKTQTDIVESLKISASTVSDWCNGKKFPRIDKIEMLADFLNIYKSDLIEERGRTDKLGNPVTLIPILGTVKAGYNYLAQENWIGTVDVETSLVGDGSNFFALKITGDSMSPILLEDDIIIVKKQNDFENGDLVVAIINGEEATIKKGKKTENSILLQPFNNNYESLIFTYDEIKSIPVLIIGIVKQLKRAF